VSIPHHLLRVFSNIIISYYSILFHYLWRKLEIHNSVNRAGIAPTFFFLSSSLVYKGLAEYAAIGVEPIIIIIVSCSGRSRDPSKKWLSPTWANVPTRSRHKRIIETLFRTATEILPRERENYCKSRLMDVDALNHNTCGTKVCMVTLESNAARTTRCGQRIVIYS
jgi:hypothetical protein